MADQPDRLDWTGSEPLRLDYGQLKNAAVNLACQLLDRGIEADDALIVQLPNITELVVVYYAASAIGAILSPVPVQYGRLFAGQSTFTACQQCTGRHADRRTRIFVRVCGGRGSRIPVHRS